MNFKKEIDILKKTFEGEMDIFDESYVEASKTLCYNAGLDTIKHLFELFNDECYEISLMDDLAETIFYIVNRYDKEGLREVSCCFKLVPETGEYFGIDHMIYRIIDSDSKYQVWTQIINELDEIDKKIILKELLRMNAESEGSRKKRINAILE